MINSISEISSDLENIESLDLSGFFLGLLLTVSLFANLLFTMSLVYLGFIYFILKISKKRILTDYEKELRILDRNAPDFLENNSEVSVHVGAWNINEPYMMYCKVKKNIIVNESYIDYYKDDQLLSLLKHEEGHHKYTPIVYFNRLTLYSVFLSLMFLVDVFYGFSILSAIFVFLIGLSFKLIDNYIRVLEEWRADINMIKEGYLEEYLESMNIDDSTEKPGYWTLFFCEYPCKNQRLIWLSRYL